MKTGNSKTKNSFENKLRALSAVGNELSRAGSVDALCRQVVELGRSRLGFDRLSVWLADKDPKVINGSFGIDETGELRYEKGRQVAMDTGLMLKQIKKSKMRSIFKRNEPMRDHKGDIVGKGTLVIAVAWNDEEVIGYLFTDNFLKKRAITRYDQELLELYAATFGHLYQAVKMKLGGEIAGGIAHEVKNSLALVLRSTEYLLEKIDHADKNISSILDNMKDAARKAYKITTGLVDYSKLTNLDLTEQEISSIIDSSLSLVKHQLDRSKVNVVKKYGENLPRINADKSKIEQVLINIFLNAVQSMPGGGTLTIKTYLANIGDRAEVVAEIEDTGAGIPEDVLDKIFDPFFTTRSGSGGSGIGLSVVKNLMDIHKGSVKIENKKDKKGVRATLALPAAMRAS